MVLLESGFITKNTEVTISSGLHDHYKSERGSNMVFPYKIGITLFGTTFGCINLALFQWFKFKKKTDLEKKDQPAEGRTD